MAQQYSCNQQQYSYQQQSSYAPAASYQQNSYQWHTQQNTPNTPLKDGGQAKWRANLCACCKDCCICWSVMCCHPITTGQLYERSAQKAILKRLPMFTCMSIALIICLLEFSSQTMEYLYGETHYKLLAGGIFNGGHIWDPSWWGNASAMEADVAQPDFEVSTHATVMLYVAQALSMLSMICVFAIVCTVRGAIRKRDGIKASCGACEDCCCAWCCNPCTQCQLLRHEKEVTGGDSGYSLCDATGVPV